MTKIASLLTLSPVVLVCALYAAPAQARARVFVASYGNDANPCTFLSPCKTFQQAVNVVDSGGEVTAIDSAGFGPISITKPVTITSPDGVEAGIVQNLGGDAIAIDTAGDVFLRGLTIEGEGKGTDGISLTGAAAGTVTTLGIVHCVIRHFTHDGILLQPTGVLKLSILDTIASNNSNDGIDLAPSGNQGYIFGAIDRSNTDSNGAHGISVWGANEARGPSANVTIVNSVSANNGQNGVYAHTTETTAVVQVMVRDTAASNNGSAGFQVDGGGDSIMYFARTVATANLYGIRITNGGAGLSYGDNNISGNYTQDVAGTPISAGFN